jgi:hypothetical protein
MVIGKTEGSGPEIGRGLYRKLKLSIAAIKVRPYRPMKFQRSRKRVYVWWILPRWRPTWTQMRLHAVIIALPRTQGALTTHPLYRPIILGFISAYEYAICLVFTKHSDKMIACHLILVW